MAQQVMTKQGVVQGEVAAGFEGVRAEFERNFSERKELGAAVAVYYRGQKVVDLWGGIADHTTKRPWTAETMVNVFSTTKGVSSVAIAMAHSRGWLDYDERVATYWPEFAQNGKENITVRQLLSHQAGVCALDEPLDLQKLSDPDVVAAACAKQAPAWEPGTQHGYHGLTLGWYESELLRKIDPQHRTIGKFFQDEIAEPLGLSFYIGLPEGFDMTKVARIKGYQQWQMLFNLNKLPWRFVKGFLSPGSLTQRTFSNPAVLGEINRYNDWEMQRIELPAANGTGTARSIAQLYGELATGGQALGIKPETMAELTAVPPAPLNGIEDQVLKIETRFGLGYSKPSSNFQFGSGESAFGTPGAGGSFGFADPEAQVGFAYVMNK
ncbi:MAG: beta-lactamase family protein, partial [Anaerolineales bacterium]|nr:beta-lactamase family protein [Anaerolineales bacterium]